MLPRLIRNTIQLAFESTVIALALGLPIACWLAIGSGRLQRAGRIVANAGIGLPPVGVGVYVFLLIGGFPFGRFWSVGMHLMVFVQSIIAIPIVVALAMAAMLRLPVGLLAQARAYGASMPRLFVFALREARLGILTAVIVALGSAIGEVGAMTVLVDPSNPEATLAMRILNDESAGHPQSDPFTSTAFQVEHSMVILAMLLLLGAILTVAQQAHGRRRISRGRGTLSWPVGAAGGEA